MAEDNYQKWYFVKCDEKMTSSSVYTEDGAYMESVTDSRGNTTSGEGVDFRNEFEDSITTDVGPVEIGPKAVERHEGNNVSEDCSLIEVKDTVELFSFGAYVFYGAEFSLSINIKYLLQVIGVIE